MTEIEEIHHLLDEFVDAWSSAGDERGRGLVMNESDLDSDEIDRFTSQIISLSTHTQTGDAIFEIEGDSDDLYEVRFNPAENRIHSEQQRGDQYNIDSVYRGESEVIDALTSIQNNTLTTGSELNDTLSVLTREGSLSVDVSYTLQKSHISRCLSNELDLECSSLSVYFYQSNFVSAFEQFEVSNFKDRLLDSTDHRALIAVLDIEEYAIGDSFGVCGVSRLDDIGDFEQGNVDWLDDFKNIRRNSLIEQQDQTFLPPSFFYIDSWSDTGLRDSIVQLTNRAIVVFTVLSLSNSAEHPDSGKWKVRIKGRQFIEGTLSNISTDSLDVLEQEGEQTIELEKSTVESLYGLYKWTFQNQVSERITVVRNVATLYARDLGEIITDANKIKQSAQSNRRYYLEESVEDFLEFRHELTDSVFQTQKEFTDIRSDLVNDLSQDIFRTVGFVIAIAAGVFFRIENLVSPRVAYTSVALLILGYAGVTLHRVLGIKRQFRAVIQNQTNFLDFYIRFFDRSELNDLGITDSRQTPWYCRPFALRYEEEDQYVGIRSEFRFDMFLYYILIAIMGGLAVVLLLDIYVFDIIREIPVSGT